MLNPASEHFLVTSLELGVVSGSLPSRILRLMVRYGIKPYRTVDDFFCKNTAVSLRPTAVTVRCAALATRLINFT
jgi:hypothetical protein